MKRTTRILLADPNALFRAGLRLLLEDGGLRVVGELPSLRLPPARLRRRDWDLLLVDPGGRARRLSALRQLAGLRRIIALSDDSRPDFALALLQAGADAFVSKRQPPTALLSALVSVKK